MKDGLHHEFPCTKEGDETNASDQSIHLLIPVANRLCET
jgi:hypothetical protein